MLKRLPNLSTCTSPNVLFCSFPSTLLSPLPCGSVTEGISTRLMWRKKKCLIQIQSTYLTSVICAESSVWMPAHLKSLPDVVLDGWVVMFWTSCTSWGLTGTFKHKFNKQKRIYLCVTFHYSTQFLCVLKWKLKCIWKHWPSSFSLSTLCLGNSLSVKAEGLQASKKNKENSVTNSKYFQIHERHCVNKCVNIKMDWYCKQHLLRFIFPTPAKHPNDPNDHNDPDYSN